MEKPTGLAALQILVDGLKTLKPEEFDYSELISETALTKDGNVCGTVCCALGWAPKYLPDSFEWVGSLTDPILAYEDQTFPTYTDLAIFFRVLEKDIRYMFYGGDRYGSLLGVRNLENYTLQEVIERIETIIQTYK